MFPFFRTESKPIVNLPPFLWTAFKAYFVMFVNSFSTALHFLFFYKVHHAMGASYVGLRMFQQNFSVLNLFVTISCLKSDNCNVHTITFLNMVFVMLV